MKTKKPNAELVWKQLEDQLAPRLRLSVIERTVYAHLLRHSRLEGKLRLHFSIMGIGRNIRLSMGPVRDAVRRLAAYGALRVVQRSKLGHVVEVRLPDEIRTPRPNRLETRPSVKEESTPARAPFNLEEVDFLRTKPLRKSIHARERGQCFYCMRRTTPTIRCLDHVVPQARSGRNSYRNLVSSCMECNSQKGETAADDFLRRLYRERRLPPPNSPPASAPSTPLLRQAPAFPALAFVGARFRDFCLPVVFTGKPVPPPTAIGRCDNLEA